VVLAGWRINDGMGRWLAEQLVLGLARRCLAVAGTNVLVLGLTFKENCPDLRNTKVVDLIQGLERYAIDVVEPWIDPSDALRKYGISVNTEVPVKGSYGAVVAAVAHGQFLKINSQHWRNFFKDNGVLLDLKRIIPRELDLLRI